jgi:hypothetical protein
MNLVPFKPEHVQHMVIQAHQQEAYLDGWEVPPGDAWTAFVDGEPIGCGGLTQLWRGRAMAWSILSRRAGPHMLAIVRVVRRKLDAEPFRRVEMAVRVGFDPGCRFADLLGFVIESKALAFMPDGGDAFIYARVRNG